MKRAFGQACATFAFVALVVHGVYAVPADEPAGPSRSSPLELSASDLHLSARALREFKSRNKMWKCFNAIMHKEGDHWQISFVAKDNVQLRGDVVVLNASKCGEGLTYLLNDNSRIVQRIYHR